MACEQVGKVSPIDSSPASNASAASPSVQPMTPSEDPYGHINLPSLTEAILETDIFLRSFGITDNIRPMDVTPPISVPAPRAAPTSPLMTPTQQSPVEGGAIPPFPIEAPAHTPSYHVLNAPAASSSSKSFSRSNSSKFRGLDPIPEDDTPDTSTARPTVNVYQPFVPPPVPKPVTTSYNISFPTTLQPRDHRLNFARNGLGPQQLNSTGVSTSPASSAESKSDAQSPFHGAMKVTPWDTSEYQPMNFIQFQHYYGSKTPQPQSSLASTTCSTPNNEENHDYKPVKGSKRSRRSTPTRQDEEDLEEECGSSSRQRKRSSSQNSAEHKRRDSIKYGLEELQRVLPHIGPPEEEKMSQALILKEGGKYIKELMKEQEQINHNIDSLNKDIDELNQQIESFQNELPDHGAPLLPRVMATRSISDKFHDHVIEKTMEDWRYWVFVNIMGHVVHSFADDVDASSGDQLENTAFEWLGRNMSLQQLRKDGYRKLAKLCAKTSIVDDPTRLPEEAISAVTSKSSGGGESWRQQNKPPS